MKGPFSSSVARIKATTCDSKISRIKAIVNSIFKALPQIMNVAVACLIFLIFAIVGVQFFKGTIAACNDGDIEDQVDCVGNFVVSGADYRMLATDDLITQCLRNGDEGSSFPRLWRSLEPNLTTPEQL